MDFSSLFGQKICLCQNIIGYEFRDPMLCAEALNLGAKFDGPPRPGIIPDGELQVVQVERNDYLAIYGNVKARDIICTQWFVAKDGKNLWAKAEVDILGNKNLYQVGCRIGLDKCLVTSPGTESISVKMMASAVDALIGAVYRDGGQKALDILLEDKLDLNYFTMMKRQSHTLK